MIILFLFIMGLVFGSFLAAFTWRTERDISIAKGRSFCPHCKHQLAWFDNIPLLSYLILHGKCRYCKKPISIRYPLIELVTALSFVGVFSFSDMFFSYMPWLSQLQGFGLVFLLLLAFCSIGILVTDIEELIIPDELVFALFVVGFFSLLFTNDSMIWSRLLVGFSSSLFFLLLHLFTAGKGMGLGDVKLAIPFGMLLGFPLALCWIFLSFILGAVIGVCMLLFGKAQLKAKIAFGPFMVVSFWICLIFGSALLQYTSILF